MTSIYDDPALRLMRQSALENFANGYVGPMEKEVLSSSPLPNEFIDSYISQSVEVKGMMEHTYVSLNLWIDEAKKANYFWHVWTCIYCIRIGLCQNIADFIIE